ncbi:hypothetical protein N8I77_011613 [Diaporthe amygdali]|uniref:Transaldolase n=1 Tax=Phomopsis amygdali TaxID=1214568 RepID=A0AAD9S6P0_PHOAM|nr:hypothetical protein N8I77_011613 [Diaporthe amygdali]
MIRGNLLQRLDKAINIDVDDVNTEFIKTLRITPKNQTSNQVIITNDLLKPKHAGLLDDLIRKHGQDGWERVYDIAAVHLCAANIPYISGRVLVQVSLRSIQDKEAVINQARFFANTFESLGVARDRFVIKVPFSGPAASAAKVLNAEGIRTLATAVFSLEQAIAASQSNCLFISPYFNEIATHLDSSLIPTNEDPALEHPMSARVVHILHTFAEAYLATGKEQPVMVIGSNHGIQELFAMAELGCQHVTISPRDLVALQETADDLAPITSQKPTHPYAAYKVVERLQTLLAMDPLAGPSWDGKLASFETDYLSDGGERLNKVLQEDNAARKRFQDATKFFLDAENRARTYIEDRMSALAESRA